MENVISERQSELYLKKASGFVIVCFIASLVGAAKQVGDDVRKKLREILQILSYLYPESTAGEILDFECLTEKQLKTLIGAQKKGSLNDLSATIGFVAVPSYSEYGEYRPFPYKIQEQGDGTQIVSMNIPWADIFKYFYGILFDLHAHASRNRQSQVDDPKKFDDRTCNSPQEWEQLINEIYTSIIKSGHSFNLSYDEGEFDDEGKENGPLIKKLANEIVYREGVPCSWVDPLPVLSFDSAVGDTKPAAASSNP